VQFRFGIFIATGTKMAGTEIGAAYHAAELALRTTGHTPNASPIANNNGRSFDAVEQRFMTEVARIMHGDLLRDREAIQYIVNRGAEPYPVMGVARSFQVPAILDAAKQLGDKELPLRCGLMSQKNPKQMNWMLADATVVFQKNREGNVVYYQGRSLHGDRKKPYYCPSAIAKVPITFEINPGGLWVGGEGFYKFAWASRYGWNVWAPLGTQAQNLPTERLRPLDHGLYMGDRNENGAGANGVKILKDRAELSGYDVTFTLVPRGHTDPDLWAAAIGYANASAEMQRLLQRQHAKKLTQAHSVL
jgi:hypothetical protein